MPSTNTPGKAGESRGLDPISFKSPAAFLLALFYCEFMTRGNYRASLSFFLYLFCLRTSSPFIKALLSADPQKVLILALHSAAFCSSFLLISLQTRRNFCFSSALHIVLHSDMLSSNPDGSGIQRMELQPAPDPQSKNRQAAGM